MFREKKVSKLMQNFDKTTFDNLFYRNARFEEVNSQKHPL